MDLQILYNNPIKTRKEKTSMRSYKHRKKNPDKRVYKKNVEYKMIDLLESTPDFEKLKGKGKEELDKALASLEKQFAKKDLYKLGKKKFYTSSEASKLGNMINAQIKKAQDLVTKGVPNSDKYLAAATKAKEDYNKLLAGEKKAYREEAKEMAKIGFGPAKKKNKDGKEIPLTPKEAAKANKRNRLREKLAERQAAKLKKLVKQLTSGMKNWKSLANSLGKKKKKASKKVATKKTTKKTYKKPTKKVSKKKVSKKKSTKKKVSKKVSVKKSAGKKAAKKASKKAKKSSSKKKKNPIRVFSNPDFEISENPKKGRKVRRKKKKNSKRSRKAKKSLASQVADMAKPKKKKKKGGRKAKKLKKIKVKALAGHPSKKKKKKKTYKKSNPISLKAIKEKFMNLPKLVSDTTLHEMKEAGSLLGGGAVLKLYDHFAKPMIIDPWLSKASAKVGRAYPALESLVDVVAMVLLGQGVRYLGAEALGKGIIGASVVQLGIKTTASISTGLGMPMSGIIGVPSMNGIIGVPSMSGIIGVPSMGAMSADFQGMGASGMQDSDFGAYYKTVGLEGSYLQAADYDSGSVIPTAPRTPEAFSGFGAYENVEYSDEGEDGDF